MRYRVGWAGAHAGINYALDLEGPVGVGRYVHLPTPKRECPRPGFCTPGHRWGHFGYVRQVDEAGAILLVMPWLDVLEDAFWWHPVRPA